MGKTVLSIIIPVYNEFQTISAVIDRIKKVKIPHVRKEIIIVDDFSDDGSREIIVRLGKKDPGMTKIHLSFINLGKGASIRQGLKYATGDIVIIQDADLELNPQEYKKIITPILENESSVVYGSRFLESKSAIPLKIKLVNKAITIFTNILFCTSLTDMETAYKAFRKEVIEGVRLRSLEFEIEAELTARIVQRGYKILEVPISYNPRRKEEGKKMHYWMGIEAIFMLLRCRLTKV